jgi:UDP-N-acetylglucosamine 2-epimerase
MAGTSACLIKAHASAALNGDWQIPDHYTNPYGDGTAGRRIVDLLHERRRVQK